MSSAITVRTRTRLTIFLAAGLSCLCFAVPASAEEAKPVRVQAPADTSSGGAARDAEPVGNRIVGGSTTTISNVPWQTALVLDEAFGVDGFQGHFCGATWLTTRIVQTAAHCVFDTDPDGASDGSATGGDGTPFLDPNDVNVVGGRTQLSTTSGQELNVQAVFYADTYDPNTLQNDLAWIVTSTAATENSSLATIDIAGSNEGSLWDTDSPTKVSGWGHTSSGGSGSDTVKIATVPIISNSDCADPLVYGSEFVPVEMVCAGVFAGGTDSCQGDSGGPLVGPSTSGPHRLVGVVSFGQGCAGVNKPGVYAAIPNYNIQSVVDQIETAQSTGDGGPVVGSGLTGAPNLAPQSIVRPPPPPPAGPAPTTTPKKCKKGQKLVKGKCKKKKKKKK